MRKKIFIGFTLLLTLIVSDCLGNEYGLGNEFDYLSWESGTVKKEAKDYGDKCRDNSASRPTDNELGFLFPGMAAKPFEPFITRTAKCYVSCVLRKMRVVNSKMEGGVKKNIVDERVFMKKVDQARVESKHKPFFEEVVQNCTKQTEGVEDECEAGFEFLKCFIRSLIPSKPNTGPRQGEERKRN